MEEAFPRIVYIFSINEFGNWRKISILIDLKYKITITTSNKHIMLHRICALHIFF
jgi:hypothetical protein